MDRAEATLRIAQTMRDANEPDVDVHEGGYMTQADTFMDAVEDAGLKVVEG